MRWAESGCSTMYAAHVFYVRTSYACLRRQAVSGGVFPRWLQGSSHGTHSVRLSSPTCRTIGGGVSVVSLLSDRPLACVWTGQSQPVWRLETGDWRATATASRGGWAPQAPEKPISTPWRSLTPLGIPSLPFLCAATWGRQCTCCPCIQVFPVVQSIRQRVSKKKKR
jgi:hypothetical protein